MKIKQFKDKPLAHYSYAILSEGEIAMVDPSRNPKQYYKYAEENKARIIAVLETHPHADFVSGHLQIHEETGAPIYISEKMGASFPHLKFEEGDQMKLGGATIKPLNTPGHSPDSLTFIVEEDGQTALFTGDTLMVGDVGRPDLRGSAGNLEIQRIELAKAMYHSIKNKFKDLPDNSIVYPAHGAGSLCGKNMGSSSSSMLGNERRSNWAFQVREEEYFVEKILEGQPFIPAYFGFNVDLNLKGAGNVQKEKYNVPLKIAVAEVETEFVVIDVRDSKNFREGHLPKSYNIMARSENDKYETWLGAIIEPGEPFYLVVESVDNVDQLLERTAKIGYERQIEGVLTLAPHLSLASDILDIEDFIKNKRKYTIIDVRNDNEIAAGKIFPDAETIPLHELRKRADQLPNDKPFVVHCAAGYRSASASSILKEKIGGQRVFDLGENVKDFK